VYSASGTAAICYAHSDFDDVNVLGTERAAGYRSYAVAKALLVGGLTVFVSDVAVVTLMWMGGCLSL
jgi:hypothetical protein